MNILLNNIFEDINANENISLDNRIQNTACCIAIKSGHSNAHCISGATTPENKPRIEMVERTDSSLL